MFLRYSLILGLVYFFYICVNFISMVSVQDLSVSFGSFDLLLNISFLINDQDRIGLAGYSCRLDWLFLKSFNLTGFGRLNNAEIF